ncbi:DUF1963 domain-containing protein [Sphingopyxis sp.]|uniref:DUF1963 domain-containing protein n=1 Tax=Sphingopyxis sp. TaxID=1908224 RepID=UPI002D7823C3|nr:DUF1963 domain-containing protein [Sphingopyxis sp.]HET6525242.1 DUF1963 domain-containing protein [Sphingopyxis sp.]
MEQILTAALTLAGVTLAFVGLAYAIWRARHPRAATAAPGPAPAARAAREYRLPKLSRRAEAAPDDVEISPSRLARIRRQTPPETVDESGYDPAPDADSPLEGESPVALETTLETLASDVAEQAHRIERDELEVEAVALRLLPQIPPRDAISTNSWLGGRPRLAAGMEWPRIDDQPADFLAQIDCTALPPDLWGGLGPREGALAFFIHRRKPEVRVLHLRDTGMPVQPPFALNDAEGWFGPHGGLGQSDLAPFAIRAFPEWPVDLIAVRAGDADPRAPADAHAAGGEFVDRSYDIADPAFHPFDWGSMTAMVALLEMRLGGLESDADAADASDPCAAINRDACERAREIIAIVHDSAARDSFSPGDATAVMAALHAIRWAKAVRFVDPETGAERIETITLPLTTHRPDADLWVQDYQTILFDRAKHAWCANPDNLSAPARAFYEPWWRDMAAFEMTAMGGEPLRPLPGFDESRDMVLLELPSSGLMSRKFGDDADLVVTIDRADLAIGDFSKVRAQLSS